MTLRQLAWQPAEPLLLELRACDMKGLTICCYSMGPELARVPSDDSVSAHFDCVQRPPRRLMTVRACCVTTYWQHCEQEAHMAYVAFAHHMKCNRAGELFSEWDVDAEGLSWLPCYLLLLAMAHSTPEECLVSHSSCLRRNSLVRSSEAEPRASSHAQYEHA